MGSRRFGITSSFVYCACAVLVLGIVAQGIVREALCGNDRLILQCGKRSIIAIHGAYVTTDATDGNTTCSQTSLLEENNFTEAHGVEGLNCSEDLRIVINRRCSGLKYCDFIYHNEAKRICDSRRSVVVVHFECVKESTLHKYCNTRLREKEGYIASPGYPLFYPRLAKCRWDLEAADGFNIVIRPLHLHLRPPTIVHYDEEYPILASLHPDEKYCDVDYLTIEEGGMKKTNLCGESLYALQPLQGEASKGVALQFTSKEFFPGSGFLIHFKVKGCATLSPPEDVYFVLRNGTEALYRCHDGRVFNDTLENLRVLSCIAEHRWNDTLYMPCVDLEEARLVVIVNHSSDNTRHGLYMENMTNDQALGPPVSQKRTSYIEDIIVPSVLMAILVIGNTIIIVIIFAIRRRHENKRSAEGEEDNLTETKEEVRPAGQTTTV